MTLTVEAPVWLRPIHEVIGQEIRSGGYVQIDETPIRYLAPGNAQTKLGYLWTTCRPRGDVIYHWERPGQSYSQ